MKTELDKKCDADAAKIVLKIVALERAKRRAERIVQVEYAVELIHRTMCKKCKTLDCDKCKIGEFYTKIEMTTPLEEIQETAELAGEGGWAERQERMEREEDNE